MYRVIVGENGNKTGHYVRTIATLQGARRIATCKACEKTISMRRNLILMDTTKKGNN